ncbi:MAG: hypothetical protein JSR15_12655 [Proteobacteria bacterium]|nr:hypothetical protein [Pseudomonadota bacterium]
MLHPLALLLNAISGWGFERVARGDWQSLGAGLVLVKACAGVNFMLLSFLAWCWLWRPRAHVGVTLRGHGAWTANPIFKTVRAMDGAAGAPMDGFMAFLKMGFAGRVTCPLLRPRIARPWAPWPLRLGAALGCAWLAALGVNALRIVLIVRCQPALEHWLAPDDAHRMIGLLTYLPALCLQWSLAERAAPGRGILLAGGAYAVLMLGLPLASGGAAADLRHFAAHVAWVLAVLAPLLGFGFWRRNCRTRRFSGS